MHSCISKEADNNVFFFQIYDILCFLFRTGDVSIDEDRWVRSSVLSER